MLYNTKQLFIWYARVTVTWMLRRILIFDSSDPETLGPSHTDISNMYLCICRMLYIMYVCVCVCTYVIYGRQIRANTTNKACEWTESAQPTIVAASFFLPSPQERWTKEQTDRQAGRHSGRRTDGQTDGRTDRLTDWQAHVNQRTET